MSRNENKKSRLELSERLKKELDSFSEALKKEVSGKRGLARKGIMKRVAKWLQLRIGNPTYELFAETLFEVAKGQENVCLERYIKSLYFSGDYEKFKKLRPVDVVRMMRYYFKKKDGTPKIPIRYAPLLLKLARNIKTSIRNTIKYRGKGSFVPEEVIFEELKREYLEEKKCFQLKRRKRKVKEKIEELKPEGDRTSY